MSKIIEPELSYMITGLCFKTHHEIGRFGKEKQYGDYFAALLQNNRIDFEREQGTRSLSPMSPRGNRCDFIIDRKIIVEIKAKSFITKEDYYQLQRYLESTGIELGMLVNFRDRHLKPKRILNTKLFHDSLQQM